MDQYMLRRLRSEASGALTKKLREAEKAFKTVDSRISELDTVIGRLYEDSALGRISRERFDALLRKYETEQAELKERHTAIKQELAEQQKRQSESEQFMEMIAAYKDITGLNQSILNELIHSIEVGPIQKEDGIRRRSIRIRYLQFCYVEIFSTEDLFANWDESMWDAWRQIDQELLQAVSV